MQILVSVIVVHGATLSALIGEAEEWCLRLTTCTSTAIADTKHTNYVNSCTPKIQKFIKNSSFYHSVTPPL